MTLRIDLIPTTKVVVESRISLTVLHRCLSIGVMHSTEQWHIWYLKLGLESLRALPFLLFIRYFVAIFYSSIAKYLELWRDVTVTSQREAAFYINIIILLKFKGNVSMHILCMMCNFNKKLCNWNHHQNLEFNLNNCYFQKYCTSF